MKKKQNIKKLGEILVSNEVVTKEQLQKALDFQTKEGGLIGEILVKLGFVNERDIVQALTVQYAFPYLPLENYDLDSELAKIIPENVARQYSVIPVDSIGNVLTVAMSNPLNEKAREDVEMITKKEVKVFIGTVSGIAEAIKKLYK